MSETSTGGRREGAAASESAAKPSRTYRSAEIFADAREVIIEHDGDLYRLRCTSKGKLILTK